MAGLDRIIDGILSDAEAEAVQIEKTAEEKAKKLIDDTQNECTVELDALKKKADDDALKYKKRIAAAVEARTRIIILKEKQQILDKMLLDSYHKLCDMPREDYEKLLKKLFLNNIRPGECTVYFSQTDIDGLSKEFISELEKCASEKNCTMTVSKDPRNISGGFILAYGGVEENCSFEALFEANKNVLSDRAAEVLFSESR